MTDIGHLTDEMKGYIAEANYLVIEADYEPQMLAAGPYPQHLKERIADLTVIRAIRNAQRHWLHTPRQGSSMYGCAI